MAIREGAWDCPQCGRERNRGPEKHCAGCGHPRGADVPFYLPDDAAEVTDEASLRRARSGPDWTCTYCDGDNRADADFCTGCGASRDGAPPRPVIEHRDEPAPRPEPARAIVSHRQRATVRLGEAPDRSPPPKTGCRASCGRISCGIGCLTLLLLAALALLGGLLAPGPGSLPPGQQVLEAPSGGGSRGSRQRGLGAPEGVVTVTGHRWTRAVDIQRLAPEVREGWRGEAPAGAEVLDVRREVRDRERVQVGTEEKVRTYTERVQVGTERVKVGTRDLGNGYFEDIYEDRPVYDDVERQGPSRAAYTVVFQDEKGQLRGYSTSENEWRSYQPGERYRAKLEGVGQVGEVLEKVEGERR